MSHVIVLDVGGTSTTLGFIHEQNLTIDYAVTVDSEPGLYNFLFLKNLVKTHSKLALNKQISVKPMVYIGLPGNFKPGVIFAHILALDVNFFWIMKNFKHHPLPIG